MTTTEVAEATVTRTEFDTVVSSKTLYAALSNVKGATAAKGEPNELLTGVLVLVNADSITVTATSRYVLAVQTITATLHPAGTKEFQFVLTPAGLKEALSMLRPYKAKEEPVWFSAGWREGGVRINIGQGEHNMTSNDCEAWPSHNYPDMRRMLTQYRPPEGVSPQPAAWFNPWALKLLGTFNLIDGLTPLKLVPAVDPKRPMQFEADGDGWKLEGLIMPVRRPL